MKKNKLDVRSKFKNRDFSYKNVPSIFESVTDGTIRKTKRYSLDSVEEQFQNYPASALKAMTLSVAGDFNSLYATLEGDYSARETSLKKAYSKGYAELGQRITNFELLVQKHNAAYQEYSRICEELLGTKVAKNLEYSDEKIKKINDNYKELEP